MKDLMYQLFADHRNLIIFLHVISAVIWVGGMIAIRFAMHPSCAQIENTKMRMERVVHALGKFFNIVWPLVVVLIITAVIMAVGLGFRAAAVDELGNVIDDYAMNLYNIVHIKEAIWMIMAINLGAMMYRRNQAVKALAVENLPRAKEMLEMISKYMVPINIALGLIAIFMGVVLRNAY